MCLYGQWWALLFQDSHACKGLSVAENTIPDDCIAFRMSIVDSIPENLTYPLCSVSHGSTYDGWKSLLTSATKTVDIASYYWTLLGHGNVTDPTDKQVNVGC